MIKNFSSAIFQGVVFHHRHHPKEHKFNYKMAMMYLDLDEIESVLSISPYCGRKWYHPLRFKREDFHGNPEITIKEAIYKTVKTQLNIDLVGPVRVLSHWRVLGFNFNPLSTYYCFDCTGEKLVAVVAEVTNTPWLERKAYALAAKNDKVQVDFDKGFTVSPFNPVNMKYQWCSSLPGSHLDIRIDTYHNSKLRFNANLKMHRQELTKASVKGLVVGVPTSAYAVVFSIYWQALKLFIKGVPFLGKNKLEPIRKH